MKFAQPLGFASLFLFLALAGCGTPPGYKGGGYDGRGYGYNRPGAIDLSGSRPYGYGYGYNRPFGYGYTRPYRFGYGYISPYGYDDN
jgi:hypothetical protein